MKGRSNLIRTKCNKTRFSKSNNQRTIKKSAIKKEDETFKLLRNFLRLPLPSLLLQNAESNNNDIKWKRTPPLSRSKTLPDLLSQENEGFIPTFNKGKEFVDDDHQIKINQGFQFQSRFASAM